MDKLDGKVAVITGGASGIGEASVRLFVEEGAQVVIADIQDNRGETLADVLGGRAVYQHTDVGEEAEVERAVSRAVSEYGRLDCMFNNAGFGGAVGPIEDIPADEYDVTMNVLLRGVFLGMKHAARQMKKQGSGSIISTASIAGLVAGHSPHIYAAAKAAVIQLTRSVAMELGESGIRVNSPLKRSGLPEDIANAAAWLASEDSSFVTGHPLIVDGGVVGGRLWSDQHEMLREHRPLSQ
jgi:NAD(P)-dependent dehydrogenase (short-subunit alcohol dehydrogenase family)